MKKLYPKVIFYTFFAFLFCFFSFHIEIQAQNPTALGLHGVSRHYNNNIGASVFRFGINDYDIKKNIENNDSTLYRRIKENDSIGYTQVLYLIHNQDTAVDIVDIAWQRIPSGNDSIEVFLYLDTLLMSIGPYLDWIQINQEPLGITTYDTSQYNVTEIIDWWRLLANYINQKRIDNPNLAHLKILSPSISGMIPNAQQMPVVDSMIAFGEDYCDAISLHIYPADVAQGREKVDFFVAKTSQKLACTEFSQSKAGEYSGWFNAINTVWTNTYDVFYGLTNKEVIDSSYSLPMDSSEWKAFMSTAPHHQNFIPEMFASMDSNCFLFACYAGMWQYGEPIFDWTELIANKTVSQFPFPNEPFYSEFTNLALLLNSGNYQSGCDNTSISENNYSLDFNIYPNPTSEYFSIKTDSKLSCNLQIYDILGKIVLQQNIENDQRINISTLSNGIYLVVLNMEGVKATEKLIIKK